MAVIAMKFCAHWTRVLLIATLAVARVASSTIPQTSCELVHQFYNTKGNHILSNAPTIGPICGGESCCGELFESKLIGDSRNHLDRYVKESVLRVSSILDTRAKRFDETFKELLSKSKKDFHEMFKRTYGIIYLQHSDVFTDLFKELERYYTTGQVTLSETMEKFFSILYVRMFKEINSQYQYEESYLKCVEKYMNDLRPFGDVPQKLKVQLTRSFVATRTLYKTLGKGAAAAQRLLELTASEECGIKLVQMQHCGTCTNQRGPGPCSSFCIHTLHHCLHDYAAISDQWDNFAEAIDKVSDRLLGPFNIEQVVEPINIKISEAIMNFQESGTAISEKIFVSCGKPKLKRRRRSALPESKVRDDVGPTQANHNSKKKKNDKKHESVTTLEKIIRDIRQKVKETKQFWRQLPYQYCNEDNVSAAPSHEGSCWNGTTIGNFTGSPLRSSISPIPSLIHEEIGVLQALSHTLEGAHQGQEVDLPEGEDEFNIISGSGSGDDGFEDQEGGEDDGDGGFDDHHDEDRNRIIHHSVSSTTKKPEFPIVVETLPPKTVAPAAGASNQSFTRAITTYVLPIILIWFGGTIADLL